MNNLEGYMVYWYNHETKEPRCHHFDPSMMKEALLYTETLRKVGLNYVVMASQNNNLIGKSGADSVKDGNLPNGESYTYTKNDALSQRAKYSDIISDSGMDPRNSFDVKKQQ